jgi:diguanylate cyclase (GGDEF)-like protein
MTLEGREELDAALAACANEPIHIPGAVQPHGALLAAGIHDGTVVAVSANTMPFLALRPEELLGRRLAEAVGDRTSNEILEAARARGHGSHVLGMFGRGGAALDALVHGRDEVAIVEVQHAADPGTAAAHVHSVRVALAALQGAATLEELLTAAVTCFRDLTVYRFDADGHGQVVAERRRDDLDSYLGLHYPASDIPEQARALMLEQPLRLIVDVDYEPQAITPTGNPYTGRPLDLGRALLRSVAPVHRQYLRNMGVVASLTVALVHDGRLWGMIACHHMTEREMSVVRGEGCRVLADVLAHRIAAAEQTEGSAHRLRLAHVGQRLLDAAAEAEAVVPALAEQARDLLGVTGADGAIVRLGDETARVGHVPPEEVVDAVRFRLPAEAGLFVSEALARDIDIETDAETASGALALRVPGEGGGDILWFRGEMVRTVTWGGDPRTPMDALDPGSVHGVRPRSSFAAWHATVRGQSRPWRSWHIDAAADLGRSLPELLRLRTASRQAAHDPLTGLLNRASFGDRLDEALLSVGAGTRSKLGVLFADLDRFKDVNDTLGHAAGDQLLVATAGRLLEAVRSSDVVARYGGDEFVVLSQGIADEEELHQLAERLVEAFHRPIELGGQSHVATLSVGYAVFGSGTTADDVVRRVDEAMYRAKRAGRNRAVGEPGPSDPP